MTADVKQIKIDELTLDADNANKGSERGVYMLDESLRQFGAGRSILVDKEGRVIAGNKTLQGAADIGLDDVLVIQTDGTKLVAVQRTDLDLTVDIEARQLAYADNRASEVGLDWDTEQILADLEGGLDLSGLWHDGELDELLEGLRAPEPAGTGIARQTLAERFVVPPFSVLDARQGYWQERKRAWIALGIESELGRGEVAGPTERTLGAIPPNQATRLSPDYDRSRERESRPQRGYARVFGQDLMRGEHKVGE